jgi:hypothetical protein
MRRRTGGTWPDNGEQQPPITLELSSNPGAGLSSTNADDWAPSGVAIVGPTAVGRGSTLVNIDNVRQLRGRLKIVTAAVTTLTVWDGTGI